MKSLYISILAGFLCFAIQETQAADPIVMDLWHDAIPGPPAVTDGAEADFTKPTDNLVAGKRIIKLGNVSRPQMHVYLPEADRANGGSVVICPGGGFSILAWDLEGTEVAEWLNDLGFAAIVLKYRVPTRQHQSPDNWEGPVMDTQRALSIARSHATQWKLDPNRMGVLGFSAGGNTAAMAAVKNGERLYQGTDKQDEAPCNVNFAILIYPAWLAEDDGSLKSEYAVSKDSPPMFFVHAADDRVTCQSSVAMFSALNRVGVPAELHVYPTGGHGYGLRPTDQPVTHWPKQAATWLNSQMQ